MVEIDPIRRRTFPLFGTIFLAIALALVPVAGLTDETISDNPAAQQAKEDKTDYEFGGQILTLTEPKTDVAPTSDNPRFQDNKNGTVSDL